MIYLFVLGFALLSVLLGVGVHALWRYQAVRLFVRSITARSHAIRQRGAVSEALREPVRFRRVKRFAAVRHEVRELVAEAEKASALRQFDLAERYYIQAITTYQDDYKVKAELAQLYLDTDRPAKAEALYIDVLKHVDDPLYRENLGHAFYSQHRYKEAYSAFQHAYAMEATPERAFALARACLILHQYKEAVPLLEEARSRLPRDSELLLSLGKAYLQTGQRTAARETFRRLSWIDPRDETVQKQLAALA
ncbi:MAG TPA: tetratricopeptide repeat protein [Candidatus Peribacteraceae bacterium]|nr:tetratricopeptide repeat protein [Candidatus Peribacteraceae bacterium]